MAYKPIEKYGIIGDMHTAALVGVDGSIDWLCHPHFDSPSVFAALLDDKKGGYFQIAPIRQDLARKQFYWPETNILISRFMSEEGVAEVVDFMTIHEAKHEDDHPHQLVRYVKTVRGCVKFNMTCQPAFNFARNDHTIEAHKNSVCFRTKETQLSLISDMDIDTKNGAATAEFTLDEGETAVFIFQDEKGNLIEAENLSLQMTENLLNETIGYWQNWLSHCNYKGRWREMVYRSALTLKLLTFKPTGAIVAAPTTGLPEEIGGERNWDYRYAWIRDAAFTLYALMRIGFSEEASAFMDWIEARCHELNADGSLQIMYGIDGRHKLDEQLLDHLDGYRGSRPVRIGNDAYNQKQLDIYGELIDTVYLYNKYGSPLSYDLWSQITQLLDYVCKNWNQEGEGIWEIRSGRQQFIYSLLMCWVALDRGLRLADKRSFPSNREKWLKNRDLIYNTVMEKGWSQERNAFIQYIGSTTLDAANLMMPLVFFVSPTDPRMLKTIEAVNSSPKKGGLVSDSLVYRYNAEETPNGMQGQEGTFNICTFWLVEALTRAGRYDKQKLAEARFMFEKMLGYSNHLGLFSEQIGQSGQALGNFPQAFTHLALISAAFNLDRSLG